MKRHICSIIWFCVLVLSCGLAHGQNILENVWNYDWAADFDPRVSVVSAPKGAVLKFAPLIGTPLVLQKQDNGPTLNWSVVAGGGGGGTVTLVDSGAGLIGGPITTVGTISMGTTGVVAGSYGTTGFFPTFSVNSRGQLTSAGSLAITVSGFANTSLSNLGTTAVNQNLIPGLGLQLGDATHLWATTYTSQVRNASGLSIDVVNDQLFDNSGNVGLDWLARQLIASNGSTVQVDWSSALNGVQVGNTVFPSVDNSFSLGKISASWQTLTLAGYIQDNSGFQALNVSARTMADEAGNLAEKYSAANRQLVASNGTTVALDWTTPGTLNASTNKISNVVDPTNPQDAATKNYVDNLSRVTSVTAGVGLNGGTITSVGTIDLANTSVVAGSYGTTGFYPTFSVNAQGQLTSAGSIAANAGTVTDVETGTGLIGGPITGVGTVAIGTTGVVSGSYGTTGFFPVFTVNAQGQLTSAGSIATSPGVTSAAAPLSISGGTVSLSGTVGAAHGGSPPTTKNLYVDIARSGGTVGTDIFTPDGSWARPFEHVMDSVNQIIANGDNGTNPYAVSILPGSYTEVLTLNNANIFNVVFNGWVTQTGGNGSGVNIGIGAGAALLSNATNTQITDLLFTNITFNGSINLTGDVNGTNFCSNQCIFRQVQLNNTSSTVTLNNVNNVDFYAVQLQGTGSVTTFQNVAFAYMQGVEGFIDGTTLHLIQNNGANQPAQAAGNYFLMSESKLGAITTIDAGSELDMIQTYASSGGSNITNNGILHDFGSTFNGPVTLNSGSSSRFEGSSLPTSAAFTVNGGATITNRNSYLALNAAFGSSAVPASHAALVTKDGHVKSTQTTAPTATVNANAGTGATCAVTHTTDNDGTVTLVTGSAAFSSGVQCGINFNLSYNVAPICVFTPQNASAGLKSVSQSIFFTSSTSQGIINFGSPEITATTYIWSYHCTETQ